MRQGYLFETLLRLVREALRDQPTHQIRQNVKLLDRTGGKREFDLVMESKIDEFTARIIFECKDTRSPVKVEKIEAFKIKIDSLPDANHAVFVSRSGFQKQAIKKAKEFGITLISMREINNEKVSAMLAVLQMQLRQLDFRLHKTWYFSDGERHDAFALNLHLLEDRSHNPAFDPRQFLAERIFPRLMQMFPNLSELVEKELDEKGEDVITTIALQKIGPGLYFMHNQKMHACTGIEFEIKHERLMVPVDPTREWEYKKWDSTTPEARAYEYDPMGLGLKIVLVNTGKEMHKIFLLDREWKEICPNLPDLFCQKEFSIRLPSTLKIADGGQS